MTTQPGITVPKNSYGTQSDEPEQHTHASTTASDEHADGSIEPNLAILTEPELYALIRKSLASLRRYDWTPTGWQEVE
jgi:hypothetical protein